jgi:hypothetical protein
LFSVHRYWYWSWYFERRESRDWDGGEEEYGADEIDGAVGVD